MRLPLTRGLAIAAAALLSGCAARGGAVAPTPRPSPTADVASGAQSPAAELSDYMAKIRHVSTAAEPARPATVLETLETRDADLAEDLRRLSAAPTGAAHRAVAERYRLRGVLDAAHRHYNAAVRLDSHDALAYEGLARVWRDWRLPHLALGDAYRAVHFAQRSAARYSTLGTVSASHLHGPAPAGQNA